MTYAYKRALKESVEYFGGNELAAQVFVDKYALRDKDKNLVELTPTDMHKRLATAFARIEKQKFGDDAMTFDAIFNYFDKFKHIIPQGSPMSGIGNPSFVTLSNCYVIDPPLDSYGGIMWTDEQIVQISKRRGGSGTDISHLRPNGTSTQNSSRSSTGPVCFARRFSHSVREVGQDGRRGALMLTLDVHHPDVVEFAQCKHDKTEITGANISIRLSDEFLQAVEDDTDYEQRWPCDAKKPTISKKVSARKVWNSIIKNAHADAEPGLLFCDRIISESPADCYAAFKTVSTNPCSELPLSVLDSCRLLLLNALGFVEKAFTKDAEFNWRKFYEYVQVAQRLMDDLVDLELESIQRIIRKIEDDSEPDHIKSRELNMWRRIHKNCELGRRTGTGATALGDTLAALGISYGSKKAIQFTERFYRTLKFGCYVSSIKLAEELGAFPVYDAKLEGDCPFFMRFSEEECDIGDEIIKGEDVIKRMCHFGRRNIGLLTSAPAGTCSLLSSSPDGYHQTTSGIEPLYLVSSTRRKKGNPGDEGFRSDFVDNNGDHWMEFDVFHPQVQRWMDITGETDITKSPWHGNCAEDLDYKHRVKLQAVAQQHVDHAISSTVNLPADASVETVKKVYETAWKAGCFESGNFVFTPHGIKDISEIVEGDEVYTHSGNTSCVTEVYDLPVEDRTFYTLKIAGLSRIKVSEEHPLLVVELDDTESKKPWNLRHKNIVWKQTKDISIGDHVVSPMCVNNTNKIDSVCIHNNVIDYVLEDTLVFPSRIIPWSTNHSIGKCSNSHPIPDKIDVDKDLMYFLGWFIAEGHYSGRSLLRLNLHVNETDIAHHICRIVKEKFNLDAKSYVMTTETGESLRIEFSCSILSQWLENTIGRGSYNKKLPDWFTYLDNTMLNQLVSSHFAGDAGVTMSKTLSYQLILARNLLEQRVYAQYDYGQGYLVEQRTNNTMSCAKPYGTLWCYRVFGVETEQRCSKVYNFAVENEDSYVVNGLAVHNCKGITVYRKGCRDGVILENRVDEGKIDVERPRVIQCDVHHTSVKGRDYFVLVGLLDGKPYEVFAGKNGFIPKTIQAGTIIRKRKNFYIAKFDGSDEDLSPITASTDEMEEVVTRLTSLSLRGGADIHRVVQQLEKVGERVELNSFARGVARILKKYIPNGTKEGETCPKCQADSVIRQEGCVQCTACGWSKCL